MPLVYRQCRYSGEVLPTSEFTIDHWDCDKVCQAPPFGPKSTPVEESYSVRQEANITESFEETYNDEDRPAWQALFDFVDADQSGRVSAAELLKAFKEMIGEEPMRLITHQVAIRGNLTYDDFIRVMFENLDAKTRDVIKRLATSLSDERARIALRRSSSMRIDSPSGSPTGRRVSFGF
jgi:hypothetical protein